MKQTLLILFLLLNASQAFGYQRMYGITPVKFPDNKNVSYDTVRELVQFLQPNTRDSDAETIAKSVLKYSKDVNLDWRLFVSILYQESSLTMDPQNCYMNELHPPMIRVKLKKKGLPVYKLVQKKPHKCMDYGIAQINFRTWGEELNLNKELLLTDIEYSINAASKILFYYKHRYGKKDPKWHLRYHSSTPEFKKAYGDVIHKRFTKINKLVKNIQESK